MARRFIFERPAAFRAALHDWFRANGRDLPWRRERSLYRTVVSEFMLQQTRIDTVLPYFDRWIRKLPTFDALAAADEEEVLKLWEGLGYYRRARNLHALAKKIAENGSPPGDAASWQELPGVGPYTAAAIVSLSFNTPAACVDGNVVRILARLTGDGTAFATNNDAVKRFGKLAAGLLDPAEPGLHNEAMMELGATVCVRRSPNCFSCPVRRFCRACAAGNPEAFPRLQSRKIEKQAVTRAWCRDGRRRLLLHRIQPDARRLAGMWELPTMEQVRLVGEDPADRGKLLLRVRRSITRFSITESIFELQLSDKEIHRVNRQPDMYWKTPDEIARLTFSGPHRRWVEKLLA